MKSCATFHNMQIDFLHLLPLRLIFATIAFSNSRASHQSTSWEEGFASNHWNFVGVGCFALPWIRENCAHS